MTSEKRETLSPILESENQIHLTMYLENNGGVLSLKTQIKKSLIEAKKFLGSALHPDEQKEFVHPIEALIVDTRTLSGLKGNVGIFRTKNTFRVLSIPIDLKRSTHVATSFHVKPLLKWIQWDREFLLLGLERNAAHIYLGDQHSIRKIDSIFYSEKLAELLKDPGELSFPDLRALKDESKKTFTYISDWIAENFSRPGRKLFVAGSAPVVDRFMKVQECAGTVKTPISQFFSEEKVPEIALRLRSLLRSETRKALEQALLTFRVADEMNRTERDLRRIAKAAVKGKVRKLIIAENRLLFGKLDRQTGNLAIHPFDLDHEDDDLLDDLAQKVLMSGGEVYLARKEDIPNELPILAILDEQKNSNIMQAGLQLVRPGFAAEAGGAS